MSRQGTIEHTGWAFAMIESLEGRVLLSAATPAADDVESVADPAAGENAALAAAPAKAALRATGTRVIPSSRSVWPGKRIGLSIVVTSRQEGQRVAVGKAAVTVMSQPDAEFVALGDKPEVVFQRTVKLAAGEAKLNLQNLPSGTYVVRARYAGDGENASSVSKPRVVFVKVRTKLDLVSLGASTRSNPPMLKASVLGPDGGWPMLDPWYFRRFDGSINWAKATLNINIPVYGGHSFDDDSSGSFSTPRIGVPRPAPPTGRVTFFDGTDVLARVRVGEDATAVFEPATMTLGRHVITAYYEGDDRYTVSWSKPWRVYITLTPTVTTLTTANSEVKPGQTLSLEARVRTADLDFVTPTGKVLIMHRGEQLAELELGTVTDLEVDLRPGKHRFTAVYVGDDNCLKSTSEVLEVTVAEK